MREDIKKVLEHLSQQEQFKGMIIRFTKTGFETIASEISTADVSAIIDELRIANSRQIAENQKIYNVDEAFRSFSDKRLVLKEEEKNKVIEGQKEKIDKLEDKVMDLELDLADAKFRLKENINSLRNAAFGEPKNEEQSLTNETSKEVVDLEFNKEEDTGDKEPMVHKSHE